MLQHHFKALAGVVLAGLCSLTAHAQMTQTPLLSKTVGLIPNIVFVFDDSSSMAVNYLYQYGGVPNGNGMPGPGGTYAAQSPDVNTMYYDPRVLYPRRVNQDGSLQAPGTANPANFPVYFYQPPNTTVYSVTGVTVNNKGALYPSSGVTGTFTAAPTGGTTATATVTTAATTSVASVTVNNKGRAYPANGVTATFSAPPAGGTTATGTVTMGTSGTVNSVTVNAGGSGFNPSGVTATFSAPSAGGVTATGTPIISATGTVTSVTVTANGTGYPLTGKTATFTAAPAGGVTATATVATTTFYPVASATKNSGGSGYTSTPTVTFSAPGAGGTLATGTAVRTANAITSITITNAGSGYTTAPTITISGGGGSGASYTAVLSGTGTVGISGITITNPGSGYVTNPTLTLGGTAGGSGATFTYTYGTTNSVTGFTVTNGGAGYASPPTITLSSPGSGAAFTSSMGTTNVITGITITNPGSGYSSVPSITLNNVGTGSGASFTVVAGTSYVIQSVNVTNAGSGYLTIPTLTIAAATGSGATFTVNTSTSSVAGVNKDWDGTGSPTTIASYFNPSYTPDANSPLAVGASVLPYPNSASSATTQYPKFRARTDCASTLYCTWTEEKQNYANWSKYHSTRIDLAMTGVGLAFQPLANTFRLGWGTINTIAVNSTLDANVQVFGDDSTAVPARTTTTDFLTWLYARGQQNLGSTPNRIAIDKVGQYFMRKDDNGPWGANPPKAANVSTSASTGSANANHAACRRNYAMLMTDGFYNDSFTISDQDSTVKTNAAGTTYTPIGPYSDKQNGSTYSNSMSDIGFKYWFNSLRTDISQNGLQSKPTDSATWPHMNFYAIGLGLVGTLDATSPAVLSSLTGNASTIPPRTLDWPAAPAPADPKAMDDMWHATVNGRGLMLNAGSATKLQASIKQIISDVSGKQDSQAGVAASATSLSTTTKKYTPLFTSQYWLGDVQAHFLDATTGNETTLAWEVETKLSTDPITGISTYASLIPTYTARNIWVGNNAGSGTRAVAFNYSAMGSLTSNMNGTVNANLINYLAGDASNEATDANAAIPTAIYRPRQTRLGDIVNSTPVFIQTNVDKTYDTVPGVTGYRAFVNTKIANRKEGVLFVGANDGMLHAFRDGSTVTGGNVVSTGAGGVEVFAYVPFAVLPTLNQLSNINYVHRYYVDGPLTETDTYLPTAARWSNMVLGTTGGGAGAVSTPGVSPTAAVYAIDTTVLNTNVNGMNASSVAWEVSSKLPAFSELGYVLSEVQSGPTLDGSWVAVFGNGYESASCKAQLFIVNIETGALIKKIDTGKGACSAGNKNGLGGVALVRNSNQQVIGVYAGDLLGNVWKFNLNNASTTNWKVDYGGDPLYTTAAGQPITAAPSVIDLATTPTATTPKPGYMVVVGTGKFYEAADINTTVQQDMYGIWDNQLMGQTSTSIGGPRVLKTQLAQTLTTTLANGTNPIDYTTKKGWYVDLLSTGERSVFAMPILVNRFIEDQTLTPSVGSTDPCVSGTGGNGTRYLVDALSGASLIPPSSTPPEPPPPPILDCITDCNSRAVINAVLLGSPPLASKVPLTCTVLNTCLPPNTNLTVKKREWRQLFMR